MSTVSRSNPTATVIDTRPGEVRVRLGDNAELPRWYPSVLDATDISTEGVMLRINQEDMVFVPYRIDADDVGLGNVDNTSDANKPVSTQVDALFAAYKARSASSWVVVPAVSSAGDYPCTGGAGPITISGLEASTSYIVSATGFFRLWSPTAGSQVKVGFRVTGTTADYLLSADIKTYAENFLTYAIDYTVISSASGTIEITPSLRWTSGTTYGHEIGFSVVVQRA